MPQIAVKISESIFAKLKRLAHQQQATYADIIEKALSAYEPGASEHASHGASEIQALIESALEPVLERLAMLENMGIVKHQHLSGVTVHVTPQNAPESALDAQPIPKGADNQGTPEIAVSEPVSGIQRKTIKEFISDLVTSGERSPAKIAKALNDSGYRTGTGSEFKRSNPQIASALKAKD
jgi:hypothetical protein